MKTLKALAATMAVLLCIFSVWPAYAGGTLTIAPRSPGDPGSFDPMDTYLMAWGNVGSQIFDGLTRRPAPGELAPGLATDWAWLDNHTRIRFTLRKGVEFHNGEPFNAQAVKFTFHRLRNKNGPQQSNYDAIKEVHVVDDYTVDFVLSHPDPVLLTKLSGYASMIVPPHYIKEKGDAYFNTHPVGTGPFQFVSYKPKISLTLERNPNYWGGAPKLDGLVYRYISEPSTQVAELLAGRLDIATNIPLSMTPVIKDHEGSKVVAVPGPITLALRFNTKEGVTANKAVRKALVMAVDRDAIIKQILLGYALPIASAQSKLSFGYDPKMERIPYNPNKAKAILKAQGIEPGTPIEISYRGNDQTFREVVQAVAGYLQMAGLSPSLNGYETNILLSDIIPNGKTGAMWQNGWGGWTFDYDNTAYAMYHSGTKWNPYISSDKLDAMLAAERGTYDKNKRLDILQDIAHYVQDHVLTMPLYNVKTVYGVSTRLKNLTLPPDGLFRFTEVTVK